MQSNAEPSKTEKRIKKVRAIFCQNACADFWNLWMKLASKMHGSGRLPWLGSQGWKRNRSEVRSCSPAAVPWRANNAVPPRHLGTWRTRRIRISFEGGHSSRRRQKLPRRIGGRVETCDKAYVWTPKDQFLQVIPMYTARPIRLKTPWPWRLAGTNWSNRVRFGQRSRRTSCFDVAYVILSEIHAWLCMLFAEVCFFGACAVLGTWPSPNKLHERFVLGVQVVLRKTQSRWHCSNPSTLRDRLPEAGDENHHFELGTVLPR